MIKVRKLLLIAGILASTLGLTASVSAKDRSVQRAQQILTLSGFEPGPVDGLWGVRTASALTEIAAEADLLVAPSSERELRPSVFAAMWQVYHQRTEAAEVAQPHLQQIVDVADARHLLERAGIGAHPSEITELVGMNPQPGGHPCFERNLWQTHKFGTAGLFVFTDLCRTTGSVGITKRKTARPFASPEIRKWGNCVTGGCAK